MAPDTRRALLENATLLVRRQGYSAFSYADLADSVGIRKASVHHHFPSKEDIGVAMVEAYTERFSELLDGISARTDVLIERVADYAALYRQGVEADHACLCGVLAAEMAVLPARVRVAVRRFFTVNLSWLERTLGESSGRDLLPDGTNSRRTARTILATLQGALLLAISLQDSEIFDQSVEGLLGSLAAPVDR